MFDKKPVIGVAGGIGSGKSMVASTFAPLGAMVIDADALVRVVYRNSDVVKQLREWWGDGVLAADGAVNRKFIAGKVFGDESALRRLEKLIHPPVHVERLQQMRRRAGDASVLAFVWDVPLLFEVGLNRECDYVVFVDCPREMRLERVAASRGWSAEELARRENLQLPLDKKRSCSDYIISNVGSADAVREQAREVFSRILTEVQRSASGGTLPAE